MTDRALIFRCLGRLTLGGKKIGLAEHELAILFVQAGLDHAVGLWGPRGAAAWLRLWADRLETNPREFRGEGYAWLDL